MAEPLISFNDREFQSLMEERGLQDVTRGVVGFAQGKIGPDTVTYEGLKDGTAPILDLLPKYQNFDPEQRQLNDEEILTLFTNVEDYGKYDPEAPEGEGFRAFTSGMAREAPEAIAGGLGFSAGVRLAMPVANLIPPAGLPGLAAKGVVILGGGLFGAISSAFAAEEAEKAVIGEQAPIIPTLQGARNWGETTTLGLSMLHAPWTLTSKAPRASKNVEFLENYKNVASGRFAATLDDAAEFTAKRAGLSEKAFKAAQDAGESLATRGTIFGQGAGLEIPKGAQKVLGFKSFNPAGTLFDPTKGPLGSRIATQVEEGVSKSLAAAREKPVRFGLIEGAAAGGAGVGAAAAQNLDPYDPSSRLIGEILGSAAVPIPAQLFLDKGPEVFLKLVRGANNWRKGDRSGLLEENLNKESTERLMAAIKASEEYEGPEQLEVLIGGLLNAERKIDPETGDIIIETPSVAAKLYGLPLEKTLTDIETQLSKRNRELGVTAAKGKEQLLANAKEAISNLTATGEPLAILAASRIQQGVFEESIQAGLEKSLSTYINAQKRVRGQADVAGEEILEDGSEAVQMGENLYNLVNKHITESKRYERELWGHTGNVRIDQFTAKNGRQINRPNSLNIFDRFTDQNGLKFRSEAGKKRFESLLSSTKIDEDLDAFRKYFDNGEGGNPITSKRLYELRSIALSKAADMKKGIAPDSDQALFMSRLADAFYQDMMGAPDASTAYNTARAYTYARNNVFTRSFLGELQVVDPDRGLRMDPAEFAKQFFRGGNAATAKRVEEINAGIKFGIDHGLKKEVFDSLTTNEAIDLLIRDSLKKFTVKNAKDGSFDISESRLNNWRNSPGTKELFSIFPQLEIDTRDVVKARNLLKATQSDMLQKGEAPEVIAFKNFVETANRPLLAISKAVDDPDNPKGLLQNYVNIINKSPDQIKDPITKQVYTRKEAREGLRMLILDEAVHFAGGLGLGFSPTKMFNRLNDPIKGTLSREDFNLMNFMVKNKLIEPQHRKDLDTAIARMRGVEDAFSQGEVEEILFKEMKPVSLLQARIAGATFGQKAQESFNNLLNKFGIGTTGGGIGGGFIAAEAGSDAVVNFYSPRP
jgi:hypothetical protein